MSAWAEAYWVKTETLKDIEDIIKFLYDNNQGLIKKAKDKWDTIIREELELLTLELI